MMPIFSKTSDNLITKKYSPWEQHRGRLAKTITIGFLIALFASTVSLGVACYTIFCQQWVLAAHSVSLFLLFLSISKILVTTVKHKLRGSQLINEISYSIRQIEIHENERSILSFQHALNTCIPNMQMLHTKSSETDKKIKERQYKLASLSSLVEKKGANKV